MSLEKFSNKRPKERKFNANHRNNKQIIEIIKQN